MQHTMLLDYIIFEFISEHRHLWFSVSLCQSLFSLYRCWYTRISRDHRFCLYIGWRCFGCPRFSVIPSKRKKNKRKKERTMGQPNRPELHFDRYHIKRVAFTLLTLRTALLRYGFPKNSGIWCCSLEYRHSHINERYQ